MHLSRLYVLIALILLTCSEGLAAAGLRIEQNDLTQGRFQTVAESIRVSFQPGGANSALPPSAQQEALDGLARIEQVLSDDSGNRRTRARERALRSEMERVNSALASRDQQAATARQASNDEERICRRERVLGSNIPEMVCRTRAQMEADRASARDTVQRQDRY